MAKLQTARLQERLLKHHLGLMSASALAVFCLYITRPYPDVITRISFSTAYVALALLVVTLSIGPWNVMRRQRSPVSNDLRRDIGIWAGILGLMHVGFGSCVHMRGRPWLYYVYQRSEGHHIFPLRHDIFGFANETGVLATIVLLLLFATSNDWSLRKLGTPRWKQLQRWNYALFLLVFLHAAAYQTLEKQQAHFVTTVAICVAITFALQSLGLYRRRVRARTHTAESVQV